MEKRGGSKELFSLLRSIKIDYEKEKGQLTTSVEDTGCGIREEKMETLFALFSNIDTANPFNPQGMGLGLALCKRLSKMLGGDIIVSSKLNEGSTFTFNIKCYARSELKRSIPEIEAALPVEYEPETVTNEIRLFIPLTLEKSCASELNMKTLETCSCAAALVVDDEPTNRLILKSYLFALGIIADEAENGQVALNRVKSRTNVECCRKYRLILMDINMPIMDGTVATQKMMELFMEDKKLRTPIVAVTAANLDFRKDMQALLSIGFADVLQKPIAKTEFISRVSSYFK